MLAGFAVVLVAAIAFPSPVAARRTPFFIDLIESPSFTDMKLSGGLEARWYVAHNPLPTDQLLVYVSVDGQATVQTSLPYETTTNWELSSDCRRGQAHDRRLPTLVPAGGSFSCLIGVECPTPGMPLPTTITVSYQLVDERGVKTEVRATAPTPVMCKEIFWEGWPPARAIPRE